jgi:hypothetical protein
VDVGVLWVVSYKGNRLLTSGRTHEDAGSQIFIMFDIPRNRSSVAPCHHLEIR